MSKTQTIIASVALACCMQFIPELAAAQETEAAPRILQASGSFFSRYEFRSGYNDLARAGFFEGGVIHPRSRDFDAVAYRARLNLDTTPLSVSDFFDVAMRLTPQSSGFWAFGTGSGQLRDAAIGLHEGFLKLIHGLSYFQIGRFEMNYGEQLMIGAVGWHQTGRSFDGGRFHVVFREGGPWFDVFATALAEGLNGAPATSITDPIGAGDAYLIGLYSGLGPLVGDMALDAYAWARLWPGSDGLSREVDDDGDPATPAVSENFNQDTSAEVTVGARAKGKAGMLDYRAEAGLQFGNRPVANAEEPVDVFAYQADVEAGVSLMDNKLRLGLEGFIASGNDPTSDTNEAWSDPFSTAHKWLGLMDIMRLRSNAAGGVFHGMIKPIKGLKLATQVHLFLRPQLPDGMGGADFKMVGSEVDLIAVYALGKGLNLRGDWGIFLPTEDGYGADQDPAFLTMITLGYAGT